VSVYYEDEYVQLYHGDCREELAWLAADVLVTDPPYGRAWKQGNIKEARWLNAQDSDAHAGIANDGDTTVRDDALKAWGGRPWVAFGDLMLPIPEGTKLTGVYWKDSGTSGFRGAISGVRRDAEAIYFGGKHPSGLGGRSSVFRFGGSVSGSHGLTGQTGHPHTKPVGLMETLIELTPSGIVADPFAGSGSTLVAARNLGRKVIGVELDEAYCEIIVRRLSQQAFDFSSLEAS
jgi:site-specific DNA-methyltransferase (adenine-specific)